MKNSVVGIKSYDLVIVGGGMAGLALASSMVVENDRARKSTGTAPLKIALVEAKTFDVALPVFSQDVHGFDPRVSALTISSIDLLQRCGAWCRISENRHAPFQSMFVWDENGTGEIAFDAADIRAKKLGCIVENRLIIDALFNTVAQSSDVDIIDGVLVENVVLEENSKGDSSEEKCANRITLDNGQTLTAELLVAADGANSVIRKLSGLALRSWDYNQSAIVCTVAISASHCNTAWQCFTEWGALAFLPLDAGDAKIPNENCQPADTKNEEVSFCSIVWSVSSEKVEELLELSNGDFRQELARRFSSKLGVVLDISQRFSFPLLQQHAVDYVRSGLALIADAAHTVHPLAGQGINMGFADVNALTRAIVKAHRRGQSIGELTVLQSYQRERKPDNLAMMAVVEAFKRLYEPLPLPLILLRNTGMKMFNQSRWIKKQIMQHAMGVK